jgi:hypothetical protein
MLPKTKVCGEKYCYIERDGPLPRVRIATCGRWHGALPQTGAMALAIARQALPHIAEVIPSGLVMHAQGVETLPPCVSRRGVLQMEMPETDVKFTDPTPYEFERKL